MKRGSARGGTGGLLMIARNNWMSALTYRAHFVFQVVASVFAVAVAYFLWKAVFAASAAGSIGGMGFEQTFLYASFAMAMTVLSKTWVDWFMWEQIRFGNIVMQMFRPVDFMAGTFFQSLGTFAGNFTTITLPSLAAIFLLFGGRVQTGSAALLFVPALLLSFVLTFLIDFIIGTTCFYTESIWGISVTKEVLVAFLSGAAIPLPFFPPAARAVLDVLPFASMYHTPLATLVDPSIPWTGHLRGIAVQAAWAVVLFVFARVYYRVSLRTLTVAGG